MDEKRLVSLRKKDKEEDDAFMERQNLTVADLTEWKRLTDNGRIYGGPALRRFV